MASSIQNFKSLRKRDSGQPPVANHQVGENAESVTPPTPPHNEMQEVKKENARILNDLMERYERKEAETRRAHQAELRRYQNENDKMKLHYVDAHNQLQRQLQEERAKHAQQLQEAKRSRSDELNALNAKHKGQIDDQIDKAQKQATQHEEYISNFKRQYADEMKRRDFERNHELDALQRQHKEEMMKAQRELEITQRQHAEQTKQLHEELTKRAAETERRKIQGDSVQAECGGLRNQNQQLMREIEVLKTKREKQVSSLEHALRELELNFKKKTEAQSLEHKQQHEQSRQEILQLKANYEQGFQDTKTQLEALLAQHQDELDQQSIKYEKYLDRQSAQYKAQIVETVAQMKDRIRSLEADLMEKPDEFRLVSDRTLKDRYRQLRLLVETISEPFNLGIKSLGSNVDQLDPTQFLARAGKNQTRFLLRNIFWTKIIDGFFSAPYGFGAFGSGGGKKMLFDLYCTWQRLFDADFVGYDSDSRTQEDFEPFYRDKYANGWRSATFQSIVAVVLPREGSRKLKVASESQNEAPSSRQQSIANAHAENANQVKKSLLEALSSVCDGVMVSEEIQDKVDETVRCAGELALEFGVHKAKICFGLPGHGDTVQIGAEFVDCEDGDSGRGALEVVELAVSPSLFMIGDGRNDLITANCLWPGEIYPRRS